MTACCAPRNGNRWTGCFVYSKGAGSAPRHVAAHVLGLGLHPIVETFGEKIFGKDQPQNQPNHQSAYELAHIRSRNSYPPFLSWAGKSPFLIAESEPGNRAKSRTGSARK